MTEITKTTEQFISLWETKKISEIAMVAEARTDWYIFTKGTTQEGGPESQNVYKVAKP